MQDKEKLTELSKNYYDNFKKNPYIENKVEILTVIMSPDFDEHYANLIKIDLLEQYIHKLSGIDNFGGTDLIIINYCYYTSIGKEATDIRKLFRRRLVQSVTLEKYEGRNFLLEDDAGEAYSKWCTIWAKDIEKNFQLFFGKDPCRWLPRAREKFVSDRETAEREGLF